MSGRSGHRRRQTNEDLAEESPEKKIKRLAKELSNTQRELQLSNEIRNQLVRIGDLTTELKDIGNRLLYKITDLTDEDLQVLHNKEKAKELELKALRRRLQMLTDVESNECSLELKLIPYKKSKKRHIVVLNKKERFVDIIEDFETPDEVTEEATD